MRRGNYQEEKYNLQNTARKYTWREWKIQSPMENKGPEDAGLSILIDFSWGFKLLLLFVMCCWTILACTSVGDNKIRTMAWRNVVCRSFQANPGLSVSKHTQQMQSTGALLVVTCSVQSRLCGFWLFWSIGQRSFNPHSSKFKHANKNWSNNHWFLYLAVGARKQSSCFFSILQQHMNKWQPIFFGACFWQRTVELIHFGNAVSP